MVPAGRPAEKISKLPQRKYELIAKGWCTNIYRVLDTDMVCTSSASSCIDAFRAEKIAYDRFEEAYESRSLWNIEPNDEDVTQNDVSILAKQRQRCLRVRKSRKTNIVAYHGADTTAPNADLNGPLRPSNADRDPSTFPASGILLSYMPYNCLGHLLGSQSHTNLGHVHQMPD